jgi:hypothetical protein
MALALGFYESKSMKIVESLPERRTSNLHEMLARAESDLRLATFRN